MAMPMPSATTQTPAPTDSQAAPQASISTGAAAVQTGGTKVHGMVTDPDGYPIPGATVMMTPAKGSARHATTGGDGSYSLVVTPGAYTVVVTMKGFASYSMTNLKIPAVPATTLDAKLTIGEATQVVNVEASSVQVSVDPDSNASATILTGKDLDALSDDPDELQSELTALAGPSAGPNGGQIYVDGFTGGQLPPKSSIREIRINQNPFSAQFDKLGYGRIEIFTKPGTDQFHGSLQIIGNTNQFNAGSPPDFNSATPTPGYHTYFILGSVSGPINKWASFNVGGSHRDIQDDAFTNATLYALPGSTTPCIPGSAGFTSCTSIPFQANTFQPQSRTDISPRIDLQLGANNVLTTRFQVVSNEQLNQGVGGFSLPTTGAYDSSSSFELQMSDTQTYGPHVINETRFEWERERASATPNSTALNINVQGAFSSGGSTSQASSDHQNHFELQNYTSIQTRKNFIRLGGRLRANSEAENTTENTNGSFTYAGLTYTGQGTDNSYATGTPSQFTQTVVNNHDISLKYEDIGLYAETDWKPLPNLTVTYGLRYESQFETNDYLAEHHDWAPRASFAYGLGKSKTAPKTVIRGGIGIFYDRFAQSSILQLIQENGTNESVFTLQGTALTSSGCSPSNVSACTANAALTGQTIYSVPVGSGHDQHLTAPYILQEAIGADQQMGRFGTLSVNYIHSLGVHALAVQNVACAPTSLFGNCTNTSAVNDQFLTEGQFHEDQLILNPKVQTTKWLSIFGYYSLISSYGDNSGASTFLSFPGNIQADKGRTTFDVRSRYFLAGSVSLPHYIQFSPFVVGQSGNPYNLTEGQDINHDSVFNDRPLLVPAGTPNSRTIAGCGTFLSRSASNASQFNQLTPSNYCTGPSLFTMNLRATKTWGFGGSRVSPNAGQGGSNGQGGSSGQGGPPGSHSSGGSSSSHSHGSSSGSHGDFFGSGSSTGQKYNFALGVQISNLFNTDNLARPVGTLTSPYFGQSTQLAGSPYTSNDALFRLQLQASFNF
jgi:hypothetical protein